ncbi:MAG: AtpZ/AtpI family protein [bacterium]|nr:AtpZ/AtpI family protein [bacterium]
MSEQNEYQNLFSKQVGKKETLKLRAISENKRSVWFGLGMMGMVGWSVVVPTLLGAILGAWLDKNYLAEPISWTLTLLLSGLFMGCLIAWFWISKEDKEMNYKIHK